MRIFIALDKDTKEEVSIKDTVSGLKCNCVCPGCGDLLVAKKGKIKEHHFSHYRAEPKPSCHESATHLMGKHIVKGFDEILIPEQSIHFNSHSYDVFDVCIAKDPVVIKERKVNIWNIREEVVIDDIKVDLLADSKYGPIAIEIAVTHFCDDEKKKKLESKGLFCLELNLSSFHKSTNKNPESDILESLSKGRLISVFNNAKVDKIQASGVAEIQSKFDRSVELHADLIEKAYHHIKSNSEIKFSLGGRCKPHTMKIKDVVLCSFESEGYNFGKIKVSGETSVGISEVNIWLEKTDNNVSIYNIQSHIANLNLSIENIANLRKKGDLGVLYLLTVPEEYQEFMISKLTSLKERQDATICEMDIPDHLKFNGVTERIISLRSKGDWIFKESPQQWKLNVFELIHKSYLLKSKQDSSITIKSLFDDFVQNVEWGNFKHPIVRETSFGVHPFIKYINQLKKICCDLEYDLADLSFANFIIALKEFAEDISQHSFSISSIDLLKTQNEAVEVKEDSEAITELARKTEKSLPEENDISDFEVEHSRKDNPLYIQSSLQL